MAGHVPQQDSQQHVGSLPVFCNKLCRQVRFYEYMSFWRTSEVAQVGGRPGSAQVVPNWNASGLPGSVRNMRRNTVSNAQGNVRPDTGVPDVQVERKL